MINKETFDKKWLEKFKSDKQYSINPPVLEKMVHALYLVEQLQIEGLNFIFKGGTSLILHFDDFNRYSIDVDIITLEQKDKVASVLENICQKGILTTFSIQHRKSKIEKIPKEHYKIQFNSIYSNLPSFILLDVLFEENSYPTVIQLPVKSKWLDVSEPFYLINVPSIDSIIGDKLTAFAPNTTGIRYNAGKELEIIKQLHDLGFLFDFVTNWQEVEESFKNTAFKEIEYRNLDRDYKIILNDIINTSLMMAKRENNKIEPYISNFNEIKRGLQSFRNYTIKSAFRMEDAVLASAKCSLIATVLLTGSAQKVLLPEKSKINTIENIEYNYLNKLLKTNKLAFQYFYYSLELLNIV